jgi:hypothetical protein
MIDINMISSTAKLYLSQCENINSKNLQEAILIAINECSNFLTKIKKDLKTDNNDSVVELLNLFLLITSLTKELEKIYVLFKES